MRQLAILSAFCAVGFSLGFYFELRQAEHEKTSIADQGLEAMQSMRASHALRAAKAIGLIQSSDREEAVEVLSVLIADYHSYPAGAMDDRQRRIKDSIETLIRTNVTVARVIKERSDNEGAK